MDKCKNKILNLFFYLSFSDAIKYDVNIEKLAKDIVTVIKRDPGIFDSILGAAKKAAKTYGPKIIKGVVSTLTEHVAGGNQPAAPAEVTQPPATLPPATQPPATTTEQSTTVM